MEFLSLQLVLYYLLLTLFIFTFHMFLMKIKCFFSTHSIWLQWNDSHATDNCYLLSNCFVQFGLVFLCYCFVQFFIPTTKIKYLKKNLSEMFRLTKHWCIRKEVTSGWGWLLHFIGCFTWVKQKRKCDFDIQFSSNSYRALYYRHIRTLLLTMSKPSVSNSDWFNFDVFYMFNIYIVHLFPLLPTSNRVPMVYDGIYFNYKRNTMINDK